MVNRIRLVVGGLPRGVDPAEVQQLLAPCGPSRFAVLDAPGESDQAMAIVELGTDMPLAGRLRSRLEQRRRKDRPLWAWITVLPWS